MAANLRTARTPILSQGVTFDDLADKYFPDETIDICKIDVEGAEFEVFLQPDHKSLVRCRYIIMEIHEHDGRRAGGYCPFWQFSDSFEKSRARTPIRQFISL